MQPPQEADQEDDGIDFDRLHAELEGTLAQVDSEVPVLHKVRTGVQKGAEGTAIAAGSGKRWYPSTGPPPGRPPPGPAPTLAGAPPGRLLPGAPPGAGPPAKPLPGPMPGAALALSLTPTHRAQDAALVASVPGAVPEAGGGS